MIAPGLIEHIALGAASPPPRFNSMRMAALRRQGSSSQPLIGQPGARNAPVLAQPGVASNAAVVQEGSLDVAAVVPAEDFDRASLQQLGVG